MTIHSKRRKERKVQNSTESTREVIEWDVNSAFVSFAGLRRVVRHGVDDGPNAY